jgi:NAD(P)-dependent dehydrogenase (short-subunit alcohol dehydrogenase family)
VYLVMRHLLPLLELPKGLKTVIGLNSISAHFASRSIAMRINKLAIDGFTEFLAGSYEVEGLMSYALHPGGVKTRMSSVKGKISAYLSESVYFGPMLSRFPCLDFKRKDNGGSG